MKKILTIALMCAIVLVLLGCPHANDGGEEEKVYLKPADETITIDDGKGGTVEMRIIGIKGGTFPMGQPNPKLHYAPAFSDDEQPVRDVTVNNFMLGSTEVTEAQWEAVMGIWPGTDPSPEPNPNPNHPARYINWYDAIRFCNKLSKSEGLDEVYYVGDEYNETTTDEVTNADATFAESSVKMDITKNGYRLPTEAEWEYAAGGATATPTVYAGTNDENELENYAVYLPGPFAEVEKGRRPVSKTYELYDMSGNVWEWCWDWYGANYYSEENNTDNPVGPDTITHRVNRGGSKGQGSFYVRVANRNVYLSFDRQQYYGFRVARSVAN